jgi:hypothetical protein
MRIETVTTILLTLITLTNGCPEPMPPSISFDAGDVDIDVTTNNYGDDDSSATDDDSAEETEPEVETFVEISFSTAWSSLGPTTVIPGGSASFGTYVFHVIGEPNAEVTIRNKGLIMATKDSDDEVTQPWSASDASGVSLEGHISACSLIQPPEGTTIQGPSSPSDEVSVMVFTDDFTIVVGENGEAYKPLQMICAFTEAEPSGTEDGFATLWEGSSFEVVDESDNLVEWELTADNGNWANPTVQVWLRAVEPVEQPLLTLSLAVTSPGGAAVPSYMPVLRFIACADVSTSVEITNIRFDIASTDNAASDWNSCANLGQPDKFALYNVSNPSVGLDTNEEFYTTSNQLCNTAPSWDNVGAVNMVIYDLIPAGTCSTYELRMDTVGVSSASDDSLQVSLIYEEWLYWFDQNGNGYNGSYADGLPIWGNALVF